MSKNPVLTKKDFVRRYALGEFGNASPTWESLEHMERDYENSFPLLNDLGQLWHIRNRIAGGLTFYDIPGEYLPNMWEATVKKVGRDNLYISAMAPTHRTLIQGEVTRDVGGLYLHYTRVKKPMREALKEEAYDCKGLDVIFSLQRYMNWLSYEWLQHLLDNYENHTIEFSVYDKPWGTVPSYNTVFWEVRRY